MMPTATTELVRGAVARPNQPTVLVGLFASWERAIEHLCDHVLTDPECRAWAMVLDEPDALPGAEDALARQEIVRQARETAGSSAQGLYDLYAGAIRQASRDATTLGWHNSESRVTVALGSAGVLFVIDGPLVVTAMLPGQGHGETVRAARGSADRLLPRERGMRSGRPGRSLPRREERRRQQRQQNWTGEERLYYEVFRPAVQFIRSRYHSYRDAGGRLLRCDYALLKAVLPPCSELSLEGWQQRRRLCGHGATP